MRVTAGEEVVMVKREREYTRGEKCDSNIHVESEKINKKRENMLGQGGGHFYSSLLVKKVSKLLRFSGTHKLVVLKICTWLETGLKIF